VTTARLPGQPLARLADLSRADWLELRRGGFGSADAPAACGLDRYRSQFALWAEKVADEWPDEDNERMLWGRKLEAVVAGHWHETAGVSLEMLLPTVMYVHPVLDWMRASPDRELVDQDWNTQAVLEVKVTGRADDWAEGPPDKVVIQVAHQLEVLGVPEAYVAVLISGREFRAYHLDADPELAGYMLDIEAELWQRVLDRNPPPADGSPSTTAAIRDLHRLVSVGTERVLDSEAEALVAELRQTKALRAELERDETELENRLKVLLGDADIALSADRRPLYTWKQQTRAAHVVPESTFRVLRLSKETDR